MLDDPAALALGLAVAYAIGCISPSYLAVRLALGRDIREAATGTAGATNVSRLLGRTAGVAVAVADIAKGAFAVWAAGAASGLPGLAIAAMTAVIVGHIWPLPLGFRGGKGLAAGFGALLWISPLTALIAGLLNLALSLALRSKTLGTLIATAAVPLLAMVSGLGIWPGIGLAVPSALVLFAHRGNWHRAYSERTEKP